MYLFSPRPWQADATAQSITQPPLLEGFVIATRERSGSVTERSVLCRWATNISKLLETVERVCQTIQKEFMVYKVPLEKGRIGEVGAA